MRTEFDSIKNELRARPVTPNPTLQPTPQANQTTQPITVQPAVESDKRWRPEEIGSFDGTGDADVYAFTDRLASIAELNPPKLVQINLVTLLKDTAFNWYHYERANETKWALNASTSIDSWYQALIRRFRSIHSDRIGQLETCRYTRKDASKKKDATGYIQEVMRSPRISSGPNNMAS